MGPGLLLYDALYVGLATLLYGCAIGAAALFGRALASFLWWPFAVFPSFLAGVGCLVGLVGLLSLACPRPRPGRYRLMKGAVFYGWLLRSLLRRLLFFPGLRWVLFSSNVLRFVALRLMGAQVAFASNMSADVELLDPALLTVGPGATIGARSLVSGHYVEDGQLVLGEVRVGAGALLAAEVLVGPGVTIGARAAVKARVALGPRASIGEGASIGADTLIDSEASIGKEAKVGTRAYVGARQVVVEGARIAAGSVLPPLNVSPEEAAAG